MGRRDQLRRRRTRRRSASSSSPTPATGSTSSISTACGSTRRSRSSTLVDANIMAEIGRARPRDGAARAGRSSVAENEPQDTRLVRPGGAGRLRARRAVERRLPPQRDGRADRPRRGVLHATRAASRRSSSRPPSTATCFRGSTTLAAAAPRARRRSTSRRPVRRLPPEPRSGRELGARAARSSARPAPASWRAMTALLLLVPGTPMLFQGQEFAASSAVPVLRRLTTAELAARVRKGRAEFLAQFPSIAAYDRQGSRSTIRPMPATFERCKLDFARARDATPPPMRCTAICFALRRETARRSRSQRAGGRRRRGAVARRRSCCGSSPTPPTTTGCSS